MELAFGAVSSVAPKLFEFLEKNHNLRGQLQPDIERVRCEFALISATIQEYDEDLHQRSGDHVHKAWIRDARQLAHRIEDCVDRFTHRLTLRPGASWICEKLHPVKTLTARNEFAAAMRGLKEESSELSRRRLEYMQPQVRDANLTTNSNTAINGGSSEEKPETADTLVGMEAAREELMELIREGQQQPNEKLKVISLVGFGGIGKSQLAWQVYNSPAIVARYKTRAWVPAAEKGARDVLESILLKLGASAGSSCRSLNNLRRNLKECLGNNSFFIVIDGMRGEFWDDIKEVFLPAIPGVSRRVIVTTDFQPIAKKCSFPDGHVYSIKTLDEQHSRQLLLEKASLVYPPPPGSQVINKCDGLPLALITTARVLYGNPTEKEWADLGKNLGEELEKNDNLATMKNVLVRSYTSLGSKEIKTCLLYLGIYPIDRPIRRGSLIRKLLAEGYVKDDPTSRRSALEVAVASFDKLVDRSIIRPIIDASSSKNVEVKTFQTHGMMLEFILYKSMCENFVTLLCDKDPPPGSNIRWLSLQHQSAATAKMWLNDLRLVRSLTIFGSADKSMLDFSKYELVRVLDLEECNEDLGDTHLKVICSKLLLLRYLSLGTAATVTVLPKEIEKLQLLETLDVRKTKIKILPIQVIKLPCLLHLFGKFKLQSVEDQEMAKLQTWLSENSILETVAGFVMDKNAKMPQLMDHMGHLKKVKIWYESTADASSNLCHLSKFIKGFIKRGTDLDRVLSLSLNINDEWSQGFLDSSLEKDCYYYLRSLKLQGSNICTIIPRFVIMLGGLTKLCLSFPGRNLSGDLLATLSIVRGLEYLKLIATQMDKLIIRHNKLGRLRHLCIVVEVMTGLEIQQGALLCLESLQLLCKDLNGFCGATTIQSLGCLKEVALHDGLSSETKDEWKEAAKNHPRRPKVLFKQERIYGAIFHSRHDAAETSTAVTATDMMAQAVNMEGEPAENYTGESVPVLTSVIENEPAANIPDAPATIGNAMPLIQQKNHENGSSTSMEGSAEMEREDQQMEDDTQAHKDDGSSLNKTTEHHSMATVQYARRSNDPLVRKVTNLLCDEAAPRHAITQSHDGGESSAPKPKRAKN